VEISNKIKGLTVRTVATIFEVQNFREVYIGALFYLFFPASLFFFILVLSILSVSSGVQTYFYEALFLNNFLEIHELFFVPFQLVVNPRLDLLNFILR